MPKFGDTSRERLETCHYDIQRIMSKAIEIYDFSVIEGIRTAEKQKEYFDNGFSHCDGYDKLSWHQDRFGDGLSRAIDIVPYYGGKQQWNNDKEFRYLSRVIFTVAQDLMFKQEISSYVVWGGSFRNLYDPAHYQIHALEII